MGRTAEFRGNYATYRYVWRCSRQQQTVPIMQRNYPQCNAPWHVWLWHKHSMTGETIDQWWNFRIPWQLCHLPIRVALQSPTTDYTHNAPQLPTVQRFFLPASLPLCPCVEPVCTFRFIEWCRRVRPTTAGDIIRASVFLPAWIVSWWRWSEQINFHVPVLRQGTRCGNRHLR